MARIVGVDHPAIRISDFGWSACVYDRQLGFTGFERDQEFDHVASRNNGKAKLWSDAAIGVRES